MKNGMADGVGLTLLNEFNALRWQTCVTARLEPKGLFGAVANRP